MFISSDTNIWLDFLEIGRLSHPFRLDFQYFLSHDTFQNELLSPQGMRDDLIRFGLRLTDMTDEEFSDAKRFTSCYPRLSMYDAYALAIAKRRGWVLLTGDRPMRNAAKQEGVETHGTIWIYDQLKAHGKVSQAEYADAINALIRAVACGKCRLPMPELSERSHHPSV